MNFLLEFEFRYHKIPKNIDFSGYASKTITVGVFETKEEAVKIGNEKLDILMGLGLTLRPNDRFVVKSKFGTLADLVTNTCYRNKVEFFGKIMKLDYTDLEEFAVQTLKDTDAYIKFKREEDNE